MSMKHTLMITVALVTLSALPAFAQDTTATDSPVLKQKAEAMLKSEPGATKVMLKESITPDLPIISTTINLDKLDTNGDGIMARDEIGEALFKIYDQNGSMIIDNIEYARPVVSTVVPMKKTTVSIVEFDGGSEVKKDITSQEFMETSGLAAFANGKDGLSARDFLGKSFNIVDVDDDHVIGAYEWKRAYAARVRPLHNEAFNYND